MKRKKSFKIQVQSQNPFVVRFITVQGYIRGVWGVWQDRGVWIITHIPSGLKMPFDLIGKNKALKALRLTSKLLGQIKEPTQLSHEEKLKWIKEIKPLLPANEQLRFPN